MKTTLKLAKTEMQVLFYSPVAWLILMIFTFQVGLLFTDSFGGMVRVQEMGVSLSNVTQNLFASGWGGVFPKVQSYLYLYVPLLTMSIMSREYSSGSIKLLYSSPITNTQIILGKYLALLFFGFVLTMTVALLTVFAAISVVNADIPAMLVGLLGLFLLFSAYAAIGLFVSSLTNYNIVAAIGTLCVLAMMNYARGLWQDIPFIRELTYWFAINGRSDTFIAGLMTTEDLVYFLLVNMLFVGFTIFRLQGIRKKQKLSLRAAKFLGLTFAVFSLGYLTTLPKTKFYYDSTYQKRNTLTPASQAIVDKLDGDFTITTYVNMLDPNYHLGLPEMYKTDIGLFEKYIRFKPEIKTRYVYYYHDTDNPQLDRQFPEMNAEQRIDTLKKFNKWNFEILPYEAIKQEVDLSEENYRFVRVLERENGTKTFLRIYDDMMKTPSESEISAAIKRLVMKDLPTVGFVVGHGERSYNNMQDRGYHTVTNQKTFRFSMINQGFGFEEVDLNKPVSPEVHILVIAEPRTKYGQEEIKNLQQYIQRGDNLVVAGEPGQQEILNELVQSLGVSFQPGILVKEQTALQPDLLTLKPTAAAGKFSFHLDPMIRREEVITMPGASGLEFDGSKGFQSTVLFQTDSVGTWSELQTKNFIDEKAVFDPASGERDNSVPVVLALSRPVGPKEQRILVTGDADWMSNSELVIQRNEVFASNFSLVAAAFYWLSDGEVPVDMRLKDPIDTSLRIGEMGWGYFGILIKYVVPIGMLLAGIFIWIRRRGR